MPISRSASPLSILLSLLILLVLTLSTPKSVHGQQGGGWIEITRPSAWAGAGTRGFSVRPRESIRIEGVTGHPAGVARVLIDGQRAALERSADGRYRFVGYATATEGVREVEVAVYPGEGPPVVRKFGIDAAADPGQAAEPASIIEGSDRARGQRWAVVVGVSSYSDDRIPDLRYADADARALHALLLSERVGLGGFAPDHVLLLTNEQATLEALRTAFYTFLRGATEDDVILIYFAGHGAPDPYRPSDLYLLTHDADVDNLPATAFPMDEVTRAVKRAYARDVLVITDACHSAGAGGQTESLRSLSNNAINQVFLEQLEASTGGIAIVTASEATQYSQEGPQWGGGHGVFTYHLVRALEGHADEDGDRIVTLGETVEWVRDRVRRATGNAQIPSVSQTAFDRGWPLTMVLEPPPPMDAPILAAPIPGRPGVGPMANPAGASQPGGPRAEPQDAAASAQPETPLQPAPIPGVQVGLYFTTLGGGQHGFADMRTAAAETQLLVRVGQELIVGPGMIMDVMAGEEDPELELYAEGLFRIAAAGPFAWWLGPHVGYRKWSESDENSFASGGESEYLARSSATLGATSSFSLRVGSVNLDLGGVMFLMPAGWTVRLGIRPGFGGGR